MPIARKKKPLPKKTSYLFTRVEPELHLRASTVAYAQHESISQWLRRLVREAVEKHEGVR